MHIHPILLRYVIFPLPASVINESSELLNCIHLLSMFLKRLFLFLPYLKTRLKLRKLVIFVLKLFYNFISLIW